MLWDRRENVNRSEGEPILSPTLAVIGALACDSVWLPDAPTILQPASVGWPFTFSFSNPRFHTADVDLTISLSLPPTSPFYQRNFDHQQKAQLHLKLSHISILASFRGRIRALMVSQPLIWTQQTAGSPSCLNLIIITGILSRIHHFSWMRWCSYLPLYLIHVSDSGVGLLFNHPWFLW